VSERAWENMAQFRAQSFEVRIEIRPWRSSTKARSSLMMLLKVAPTVRAASQLRQSCVTAPEVVACAQEFKSNREGPDLPPLVL
jgi:hypothetical protein